MMFQINDTVVLKKTILEHELKEGSVGVVVAEFCEPNEAYEIEFCDDEGNTVAQLALLPGQISKLD